jgi:hypothetical protein
MVTAWRLDMVDNLPPEARQELDHLARALIVRDSRIYLDGSDSGSAAGRPGA